MHPSSQSRMPDCLFIGPQKAGTSWVHEYLASRGDICLPRGVKETFFFDERFCRKPLTWYARHFQHAHASHRRIIEVAPTYFHCQEAPCRILQTLGSIQIVVTLRHPVSRSYSLYRHMRRYGWTDLPLRQAINNHPAIIDSSLYAKHLLRWFEIFGRHKVTVLFQEDLALNAVQFSELLNRHLDLEQVNSTFDVHKRINEAANGPSRRLAALARRFGDSLRDHQIYWPIELAKGLGLKQFVFGKPATGTSVRLDDEDRAWLEAQFRDDIRHLSELLDRDFNHWLNPRP